MRHVVTRPMRTVTYKVSRPLKNGQSVHVQVLDDEGHVVATVYPKISDFPNRVFIDERWITEKEWHEFHAAILKAFAEIRKWQYGQDRKGSVHR